MGLKEADIRTSEASVTSSRILVSLPIEAPIGVIVGYTLLSGGTSQLERQIVTQSRPQLRHFSSGNTEYFGGHGKTGLCVILADV